MSALFRISPWFELCFLLAMLVSSKWCAARLAADEIKMQSVLLTLIEQVEVPAQESGMLHQNIAREGSWVKRGNLLAQVVDNAARLAVDHARMETEMALNEASNDVDVRFARKSLQVARAEQQRANDSVDRFARSISQSELDRLKLTVQRAELEVELAEHRFALARFQQLIKQNEMEMAQDVVARHRLTAPFDGLVV